MTVCAALVAADAMTPSSSTTGELVAAAREGQPGAWRELVSRYEGLVRGVVGSYRLQEADVADAVQNTWLRAFQRLDTVRDADSLGGWLATVARRECLALLARSRREVPAEIGEVYLAGGEPGPEAAVLAEEARQAVIHAVSELPARRRELVRVLFSSGKPDYAEVSRLVGLPVGSIGPTRQRTLRTLRCQLARVGQDVGLRG